MAKHIAPKIVSGFLPYPSKNNITKTATPIATPIAYETYMDP